MKPLILITNDDGILSPGIKAAAEAVEHLGELLIVAPRYQQTSSGRALFKTPDMGTIETYEFEINGKMHKAYGVHGTPALSVSHAVLEIADRKIDLCISGINYGENLGLGLVISGTIGAALEANSYNIPAIAVSTDEDVSMISSEDYNSLNWEPAKYFTAKFSSKVLKEGLPKDIALLNINVPIDANSETEVRVTSQSRQDYFIFKKPEKRDFSGPYKLKVEKMIDNETLEKDSDIKAFAIDMVVSVTPLTWNMTAGIKYSI